MYPARTLADYSSCVLLNKLRTKPPGVFKYVHYALKIFYFNLKFKNLKLFTS